MTEDAIYFSFRRSHSVIRELRQPAVDFFAFLALLLPDFRTNRLYKREDTWQGEFASVKETPPCVSSLFIKGWWSDLS